MCLIHQKQFTLRTITVAKIIYQTLAYYSATPMNRSVVFIIITHIAVLLGILAY